MKTHQHQDNDALGREVMQRAAKEFMASAGATAPVLDVDPDPAPRSATKPSVKQARKKMPLIVGGVLVVTILVGAFIFTTVEPPPKSPILAEIDAASRHPPTPAPVEPTPAQPTLVEPTPVQPTLIEPTPAQPTLVEPTPAQPTLVEPAPVQPTPVQPVDSTEIENLRLKVRSLERATLTPTTIHVVEVLDDGVVLKDNQGRTTIVPQGGEVSARAGRVEGQ